MPTPPALSTSGSVTLALIVMLAAVGVTSLITLGGAARYVVLTLVVLGNLLAIWSLAQQSRRRGQAELGSGPASPPAADPLNPPRAPQTPW